jgi:hypothetical protein
LKKRSAASFSLEAVAVLNDFDVNHLESGNVTEAIRFLTKSLYRMQGIYTPYSLVVPCTTFVAEETFLGGSRDCMVGSSGHVGQDFVNPTKGGYREAIANLPQC